MRFIKQQNLAILIVLLLAAPTRSVQALGSYARFYGDQRGLHAGEIAALAQDQTGFIWIGSQGGLLRFDGDTFVRFASRQISHGVTGLWWQTGTGLLIQTERHRAFVEQAGQVHPLVGPNNQPITDLRSATFDSTGQLWVIIGHNVWRRNLSSQWSEVPAKEFYNEQPRRLSRLAQGIALITDKGAWQLDEKAHPHLLLHAPELFAAAGGGAHPLWLVTHGDGDLWRREHGHFVPVTRVGGRVLDMRYRGNTLWVSVDRFLLAIEPDNSMFTLDVNHGLPSGGPLLVDHEGSLWVGTFVGLQQYPEPETQHWTELDGLPWQHAFDVATADGQVWVNTWGGAVRFDTHRTIPRMMRMAGIGGVFCADQEGRMWQTIKTHLSYWKKGRYVRSNAAERPILNLEACAPATDGGLWLATNNGVFHVDNLTGHVQRVIAPNDKTGGDFVDLAWQQNADTLWTMNSDGFCRYQLNSLQAHLVACTRQHFEGGFFHVVKISPGQFWLSTSAGLFLFDGHDAHLLMGNQQLPGGRFHTIRSALSGGYWAVGPGVLERILPCNGCAAGFQVLERIGTWQGVPTDSALDIAELPSGDLWIAGNRGVFHVPAEARPGPPAPPPLVLVEVKVDDKAQALDMPLKVQPSQQQISISFAALTFRDRSLLHYRFRNGVDKTWSSPTRNPELQLINPDHGDYHVEAEASLDGKIWSEPVSYTFSVLPHWYETLWARIGLLLLVCAVLVLAIRLWLEYRLRLERQRVRIAMDLHDEIGSTLGSINMLVGAVIHDDSDASERHRLLNGISDSVTRLGSALRTVVWTMRQLTVDMKQLLAEMADQARHLLPGESPLFKVDATDAMEGVLVNPMIRRHVLMIALEAVHNVVRHAHARQVTLQLSRLENGHWRMTLRDDGSGFDSHAESRGSGLENMRHRARLIQAVLSVYSEPGAGTAITLDFLPQGKR